MFLKSRKLLINIPKLGEKIRLLEVTRFASCDYIFVVCFVWYWEASHLIFEISLKVLRQFSRSSWLFSSSSAFLLFIGSIGFLVLHQLSRSSSAFSSFNSILVLQQLSLFSTAFSFFNSFPSLQQLSRSSSAFPFFMEIN